MFVAPFAGAWIEIFYRRCCLRRRCPSLPSRERGLKSAVAAEALLLPSVAPFAGAWIEIVTPLPARTITPVAPFAGAWIEMFKLDAICSNRSVAPFAGAWIEMICFVRARECL